jgi:Cellulase (glycosyl hydrolase family 5)
MGGQDVQLRGVNRAVFEKQQRDRGRADRPDLGQRDARLEDQCRRVTLNEDCWLGINGLPLDGNAASYRAEVADYVGLPRRNGLYVLLVPESSTLGSQRSTQSSVAATFKDDHGIVFDPITKVAIASVNNPHPDPPGERNCWLLGCTLDPVYGGRFVAAGLQSLVDAIRSQAATRPIVVGGISYNADLSQLLSHLPSDPRHQLIASAHVYDFAEGSDFDACSRTSSRRSPSSCR